MPSGNLEHWEQAEEERSAFSASLVDDSNLVAPKKRIDRYLDPPSIHGMISNTVSPCLASQRIKPFSNMDVVMATIPLSLRFGTPKLKH